MQTPAIVPIRLESPETDLLTLKSKHAAMWHGQSLTVSAFLFVFIRR